MKLLIDRDGNVTMLANEETEGIAKALGTSIKRRASRILPCNMLLRLIFLVIRNLCADTSRIAQWTRGWKIRWYVDLSLSNGPIVYSFDDRKKAINFEIRWLENNSFGAAK